VNTAGGDVKGGDNSANQTGLNGALSGAGNKAGTTQDGEGQSQSG
jgi:hypothetical protein